MRSRVKPTKERPRARRRSATVRAGAASVAALAVAALAACSSSAAPAASKPASAAKVAGGHCRPGATKLTFWAWAAGYNLAVSKFNATHPGICVTLENAGATSVEYTKISDAQKAGSGEPDVA
jgi:multiple sugar transport system substrate-binding protein